jgi:hypothetical protein
MITRRTNVVTWAALLLVGLSVVACVRSVDVSKIKCVDKATCPTNYSCNMDHGTWGRCVQGAVSVDSGTGGGGAIDAQPGEVSATGGSHDSGAGVDAASDASMATGGTGGNVAFDGPMATGGTGGEVYDALSSGGLSSTGGVSSTGGSTSSGTQPKGSSCTADSQCAAGLYCVDGVCCTSKCDGQCQACNEADSVGTCKTVQGGPRGSRAVCSGSGKCQGQCDGTNATACLMPGTSTTCKDAICTNGSATAVSTCNGSGTCVTPAPKTCTSSLCASDGSGVCAGSCTATSCPTGSYCDFTGSCVQKKPNGTGNACSTGAECSSGHCSVEGLCCSSDCTGQCQTCNSAAGTCTRVNSGQPVGGRAACTQAGTTCGGTCDGSSDTACHYPGTEQTCGMATCSTDSASTVTPVCNGSGTCGSATTSCGANAYCSGGSCTPKGTGSCTNNIQCSSGNCSSGLCCASGLVNSNGVCCASGLTGCAGQCVNTNTSNTYCGSCTRTCTGGNTCSGGVCACPNTSGACGPTCSACGTGQECTGGNCACPGGAAFRCNACLNWDFEAGSTSGWTLSTRNDGTGSLKLVTSAGRGNYSLMIQNASFPSVTSDLLVQISLCSGASVPIPASGFTFSVDVLFQSNGYGFGDDGTGSGNPGAVLEGDAGAAFSHLIASNIGPFTSGTWYSPWSWTFTGTSVSTIDLRFSPQAPWSGNIILDNISIK